MTFDEKVYQARWYRENRERILARQRERRGDPAFQEQQRAYLARVRERTLMVRAEFRRRNRVRLSLLDRQSRMGITPERFLAQMEAQRGECAVCRKDLRSIPPKHVHADHDHKTGKFRGILCHKCNTAIGLLGDDPALLLVAVAYLRDAASPGLRAA